MSELKTAQRDLFTKYEFLCPHCKRERVWLLQFHRFEHEPPAPKKRVVTTQCISCRKTSEVTYKA